MDEIKFLASLWSVKKDRDGEVTLVLKVPKSDQHYVMNLPEETAFCVSITNTEKQDASH